LHAEVFQHRLAASICAVFAIFELRVRRRSPYRRSFPYNDPLALVFPLMCALGGAVLLTHSHSADLSSNVKKKLFADLSHVPMGVLAVFAGWSRWLEVRLPPAHRKLLAWAWPLCFVLMGLGLLNYREM